MNAPDVAIQQFAASIAERIRSTVPIELDLWSSTEVAQYLKVSEKQVTDRIACLPSFPCAIRLPTGEKGRGHPRWEAADVIEWARKFKEKRK